MDRLTRRSLFDTGKRGLYYISPNANGKPTLFLLSNDASRPRPLHTFERLVGWGFQLAPDEKSAIVTLTDSGNSDLYLIESFR